MLVSKRAAAGLVVAVIVTLAGCGSSARGTGQIRTPPMILTCLRGEHVSADTMFPLGHMHPGKGLVAPEALVVIDHGASLTGQIVVYRNRVAAASAFARGGANNAELLDGNAIIELAAIPVPPRSAAVKMLERCAFGVRSEPRSSPYYVAAYAHPLTGHAVMLRSGCLACHQIDQAGNNGPGSNLSDIGARLSPAAIASALAKPTAPMPSYKAIEQADPHAWRALVSYLSRLRTG